MARLREVDLDRAEEIIEDVAHKGEPCTERREPPKKQRAIFYTKLPSDPKGVLFLGSRRFFAGKRSSLRARVQANFARLQAISTIRPPL